MVAVTDTSPIRYLVRLGVIDFLPNMFRQVLLPTAVIHTAVIQELQSPKAPREVQSFLEAPPPWLERCAPGLDSDVTVQTDLHGGERQVISATLEIPKAVAVLDDLAARRYAKRRGLSVIGTVGILMRAGEAGRVDLEPTLASLERMGFYLGDALRKRAMERSR